MINEVLNILNTALTGLHADEKIYGLAQSVVRVVGSEKELLPGIIDRTGEISYVGIDDVSSLIFYHKLNSLSSVAKTSGVGDRPGDIVNTYGLATIIYWDRKRYNKMPDELILLIQARIPQIITGLEDIKLTKIKTGNANFSSLQVYMQEYQGTEFKLPPSANLIQLGLTIEITFNPDCLPTC